MVNIRMQSSTPSSNAQSPSVGPVSTPPKMSAGSGLAPKIFVIGVGGAGGNAVNNMISSGQDGAEFMVCNSDAQALDHSLAHHKIQLGVNVTGGLGAGSKPEIGRAAAEETLDELMSHLQGANMVFVTAGMGGGTGTGAAPVIAKACREQGILTVGVVTKPFHFEGTHRMRTAEKGIEEMQEFVDTLIVIPNQNLFRVADEKTTFAEAFEMADGVLKSGVCGVTDLMVKPGLVNLDFADIRTAMLEMGKAMMGTGEAQGEKRAIQAAEAAINNPLLDDVSMKGAHGVIINVTGGYDMTLFEADEACNRIRDEVDPNANIIFGATFDDKMEGTMRVSIVATGIEKEVCRNASPMGGMGSGSNGGGLNRAAPKTSEQAAAPVSSSAEISAPVEQSSPSMPAPAPAAMPEAASMNMAAAPSEVNDADMFEQASLGGMSQSEEMPQNTALRGTRLNDSFIPPKPAESNQYMVSEAPVAQTSPAAPMSLSAPARAGVAASSAASVPNIKPVGSSLKLNPPKLPNVEEKKRSPSIFERISGAVQSKLEGVLEELERDESQTAQARTAAPKPSPRMSMRSGGAAPAEPAQGALNIDAPAAKPKTQENSELDIPAFLRRQAN